MSKPWPPSGYERKWPPEGHPGHCVLCRKRWEAQLSDEETPVPDEILAELPRMIAEELGEDPDV